MTATSPSQLSPAVQTELDALILPATAEGTAAGAGEEDLPLHVLKADSDPLSLEGLLSTIAKLERLRRIDLPTDLFRD